MSQALLHHVSTQSVKKDLPLLKVGSVVRVHQKIVEGDKERVQIFQGLVIRVNAGKTAVDKTFTVRKVVEGVGVEKVFPLAGSMIEKIEQVRQGKVRRAKLYYMRDLRGKSTRLKDQALMDMGVIAGPEVKETIEEVVEAPVEEPAQEAAVEEASVEAAPAEEKPAE